MPKPVADPSAWVGATHEDPPADVVVERGHVLHWLEATENANPLFWDDAVAQEIAGGAVAPPTMLSVWMRPLVWRPGGEDVRRPLELHFRLKEAFGLPEGIVTGNEIVFHAPVRLGDRICTRQTIREIGEERSGRLGTGRDWVVDVTYANQRGDVIGVETYFMFSYRRP